MKRIQLPAVLFGITCACGGYWVGALRHPDAASLVEAKAPDAVTAPPFIAAATFGDKNPGTHIDSKFSLMASNMDPRECLAMAEAAGDGKCRALAALLKAWIKASAMNEDEKKALFARIDAAASDTRSLVYLASIFEENALSAYRLPFMEAFQNSPVRSALFSWMVGQDASSNPARLAEVCRNWLPWEKTNFLLLATKRWAAHHPAMARAWCQEHPGENEPMLAEATSWLVRQDHEAGRKILETSASSAERVAAAGELGRIFAVEDTRKAVAWAETLTDGPEKDAAHEAIYQAVPRGVGAIIMMSDDGLPVIQSIMDAGPLAKAGFQGGDVIAGIESSSGWQDFSSTKLEDVITQLRGEPGTQITVVAMRYDAATGHRVEFRKVVSREQLVMQSKAP